MTPAPPQSQQDLELLHEMFAKLDFETLQQIWEESHGSIQATIDKAVLTLGERSFRIWCVRESVCVWLSERVCG